MPNRRRTFRQDYFLCAGRVGVTIGESAVSQLEAGNFVGEVAFLTERPATATVIAETEVCALAFERDKVKRFFQNETEVAGLIYQLIGRELAPKIKLSNTLLAAEPLEAAALGVGPLRAPSLVAGRTPA